MSNVYLTGVDDAVKKLKDMRLTKVKQAVRKGSRAACKQILPKAKAMAPSKTGSLKQQMKVRALPRSRKWTGTMVTTKTLFYGQFVELGTKPHGKNPGIKAKKFLREAAASSHDIAVNAMATAIKEAVTA